MTRKMKTLAPVGWFISAAAVIAMAPPPAAAQATETVLHSFRSNVPVGSNPSYKLLRDSAGNLYGTAAGGQNGAGVLYRVDTTGRETLLHTFTGGADGAYPDSGVIGDSAGNLYGTTSGGGAANAGVVYKLDATGHETVFYSFTGGADGGTPTAGVVRDAAGNLYGTAASGGATNSGVVYRLDPAGCWRRIPGLPGLAFASADRLKL